ncbi:MAG: phosphoadenosine phosphosulfate reductase family protein, partial [Desulfovibrionales bacterium]
ETTLSLEEKVHISRNRIRATLDAYGLEHTVVAWTGGKDSTVVLHLMRRIVREKYGEDARVRAVNLDTGCKFPEVTALRDRLSREWGIELHVARPEVSLEGYPLAEDTVQCCRDLKIDPLRRAISRLSIRALLTGLRHDEHPSRKQRQWREERLDPDHVQINPILHWTEMDIWAFHMQDKLPYCTLYEQGYRSLGCMPCTGLGSGEEERSGRSQDKEHQLELLRSLGYF